MTRLVKLEISHVPADLSVYAALFSNLQNARYLLGELRRQNKELEYSFLDARKILSSTHLEAAIFRAINDTSNGRLKSHNVHSEVVLSLNMNNNIGESLRKFGLTESTRDLLVVKITDSPPSTIAPPLDKAIEADDQDFDDAALQRLADVDEIKKLYKLNNNAGKDKSVKKDGTALTHSAAGRPDLESEIIGLIALRGAT